MRLLLINPRFPESFWSFKWAVDGILPRKRAINPPLGLATLAALCPPHWQVEIVDENIESVPLAPRVDIVAIGGMGVQFDRQRELLTYYRAKGHYVVAGGSYASLCPERFECLADTVICGEAEYIWGDFCSDFEAGVPRALYRETGVVSLADSPTPRFDLLKLERYTTVTLQFSRGCPFRCEFCDIIVMFGRTPRWKSDEQVGRELDELRRRHVHSVFFVDDNLIGNKKAARGLLRFLREYQERHGYRFAFGSEASLNLAQDEGLLRLFREANFAWLFFGIESPDAASLKETGKVQNLREDMLDSISRIYGHGIDVLAGFIVGFDNDTLDAFERQFRFIRASGIQAAMIGLLTALPRTPLYLRLEREGRLIDRAGNSDNTKLATNVRPLRMEYDAMVASYKALYERLLDDANIAARVRAKMRQLRAPNYQGGEYALRERVGIVYRLFVKGLLPGGPGRVMHFVRSFPWRAPEKMPQAINDWIAGLAMRDYVRRHFGGCSDEQRATLARLVDRLRAAVANHVDTGRAAISLDGVTATLPRLSVSLAEGLDRAFFARTTRHLRRLMRRTSARVTLRINALGAAEASCLDRSLRKLTRYGDRISIVAQERALALIRVDSSVFELILAGSVDQAGPCGYPGAAEARAARDAQGRPEPSAR